MSFTYTSIPNLLTKEECDLILNFSLEHLTLKQAGIVGEIKPNYDKRKSNVAFYPYYEKFPFILEKITKLLQENINQNKRYCSLVIQLNDGYEDGDLELKLSDGSIMKVEKGIGNTIVFLSNIEHRVTGVKSGVRYTLVNWVGIQEKNNYKKTLL